MRAQAAAWEAQRLAQAEAARRNAEAAKLQAEQRSAEEREAQERAQREREREEQEYAEFERKAREKAQRIAEAERKLNERRVVETPPPASTKNGNAKVPKIPLERAVPVSSWTERLFGKRQKPPEPDPEPSFVLDRISRDFGIIAEDADGSAEADASGAGQAETVPDGRGGSEQATVFAQAAPASEKTTHEAL